MGKKFAELYEQLNRLTYKQGFTDGFNAAKKEIVIKQLIDAIIPVRCKDCKNYRPGNIVAPCLKVLRGENADDNWFCADGERREE